MSQSRRREREQKFKDLLERIVKSPLYRQKLAEYRLKGVGLDRIRTLPLTTKEELRQAGSFGHLAVGLADIAQYHESTGTTGTPAGSWYTRRDLQTGARQFRECDVRLTAEDLVLIRFPFAMALPAFLLQQAAWKAGAGVVPASSRTAVMPYPRVLELLARLRVTVMAGLPREMELLAETARLQGREAEDFPALRAICCAGELMSERRRKHIERLWGVPVYNLYGSTETGNIAAMCDHGTMHIVERDFFVEVLKEDGSGPAAPGERGVAAITTLSHEASPLLRYFNEDVISVEPSWCACGRSGSKLMHFGRARDRLRFGSIVLDAADVHEAVYALDPVPDAWKAVEKERGLHLLLDSHESEAWSAEELRIRLSSALRVPVTVEIASLLDRGELTSIVPSVKPSYIQKLDHPEPSPLAASLVRDLILSARRKLAQDDYDDARELCRQAVAADPQNAEARAWLAAAYGRRMEAGDMMEKMKLLPMLEKEIAESLALDPELPIARRVNGFRLLRTPETMGGNPASAAAEFQYCIGSGMDDADVWAALGECYQKLGKTEEAGGAMREALARNPAHRKANEHLIEGSADLER